MGTEEGCCLPNSALDRVSRLFSSSQTLKKLRGGDEKAGDVPLSAKAIQSQAIGSTRDACSGS